MRTESDIVYQTVAPQHFLPCLEGIDLALQSEGLLCTCRHGGDGEDNGDYRNSRSVITISHYSGGLVVS